MANLVLLVTESPANPDTASLRLLDARSGRTIRGPRLVSFLLLDCAKFDLLGYEFNALRTGILPAVDL